jgi:hypothetical protein
VQGQADLMKVVLAACAAGRLACHLHGGEQKSHENGDDGNDDEQLNQCKSMAARHKHLLLAKK